LNSTASENALSLETGVLGGLELWKKAMHPPGMMKSKPVIFVRAVSIIFYAFLAVILALERLEVSHRPDYGLLMGVGFIIWGPGPVIQA
jgi:hypothetical protein